LKLKRRAEDINAISGADEIELSTAQSGADSSTGLPKRDTMGG